MVKFDLGWLRADNNFDGKARLECGNTFFQRPLDIDKLIDIMYKRLGEEGILGVVEASDERRFEKLISMLNSKYELESFGNAAYLTGQKLWFVRGEEVYMGQKGKEGRVFVLGLKDEEKIPHNASMKDTYKIAIENNGTIIANPHNVTLPEERLWYTSAIENSKRFHARQKFTIGHVQTSRGHTLEEIGTSYTDLSQPIPRNDDLSADSIKNYLYEQISHATGGKKSHLYSFAGNVLHYQRLRKWGKVAGRREVDEMGIAQ